MVIKTDVLTDLGLPQDYNRKLTPSQRTSAADLYEAALRIKRGEIVDPQLAYDDIMTLFTIGIQEKILPLYLAHLLTLPFVESR